MNNSKRIYRAAIYVRLSKEDGDLDDVRKAESNSISNQKSLILNYLKDKEDIEIVSIREDDGYSGATFDRPAFKLMMQDVKDGIIDCIVVKDLSRFAREYIDAGRYIERMFPAMGIRFIAINDAYDSADTQAQGNEIIIPFKNLINDAYCRDISIKIRSHLETKRQNGEFVGNYCVYGYKKSEIDHNVIVPDEYAGPVVQDIFHWIKNGMSLDAISDKLNALGILSPMAYKLSKGENYKTAFQKKDELLWTPVAVRRIATNIIYTGTLVQGKITTPNHKVKTRTGEMGSMPQQSRGTGIFKNIPDCTASVVSGYENGTGERLYLSFIRNSSMCRLWSTYDTKGVYGKWEKVCLLYVFQ